MVDRCSWSLSNKYMPCGGPLGIFATFCKAVCAYIVVSQWSTGLESSAWTTFQSARWHYSSRATRMSRPHIVILLIHGLVVWLGWWTTPCHVVYICMQCMSLCVLPTRCEDYLCICFALCHPMNVGQYIMFPFSGQFDLHVESVPVRLSL